MAAMFPGQVSAVQVGTYFVGQYYQILQQQPSSAYQFYTDASTMMRIDGATIEKATAVMQIHSLVTSLNFTGIEIKTAHSLDSWNGGVLVMVSGFVQTRDYSARRKFMQTFFLAPQEKGYFVLNDIFHFLDDEPIHETPAAVSAQINYESNINDSKSIQEPVSEYVLGEEIQAKDYGAPVPEIQARDYVAPVHTEENETVDKYSISEPQHQVSETDNRVDETPVEELVASFPSAMNLMRDLPLAPVEESAGDRPKQTYASILRLAKGPGNSVPHAASLSKTTLVASDAPQSTPQQSYPALSTGPEKFNSEAVEDVPTAEDEGEGKSVYVGNLPSSVSAFDLEQEFKNFGRIKPDGVTVRSRKDSGGFYAFVEFEDAIGVHNALKASPIQLNGRQIYVEERKPNNGISRGGRRGRGRGGYQPDATRGRFGGRNLGRGSGTDGSDREYNNSRQRANGVHLRVPRQERGILGSHAMRNGQNPSEAAS